MGQGQSVSSTPSIPSTASNQQPPHLIPSANAADSSACPVDHKSRETWLRAATQQQVSQTSPDQQLPLAPHPLPPGADASSAQACPVDHKSREAWLRASQRQPVSSSDGEVSSIAPAATGPIRPRITNHRLSTHREVSTIPRGYLPTLPADTNPPPAQPPASGTTTSSTPYKLPNPAPTAHGASSSPNSESTSDPHTSPTGHWVYPSESQFFSAMARKSYNPSAPDMSSIIPIHNAVNERTWHHILRWERGRGGEACGGPKLVSFQGDASKISPRAWWLSTIWGYQKPFDRHDWVVERCGKRVDYIIDFYEGKAGAPSRSVGSEASAKKGGALGGPVSFYLDVRPKLNSFEGVKMRVQRFLGFD